jgi:GcrA cell cycle regulator
MMPWQLATWTDERRELVRELWAQGYSASQIGRQLDPPVTRNAVIGLCYRNQFPHGKRRTAPMPSPEPLSPAYFLREEPKPPVVRPALQLRPQPPQPPAFLGLPLEQLTDSQCRWPEGDGPFVFCGQSSVLGRPYCALHNAKAIR